MYEYKAFGLHIHSEIFLPELVTKRSENPDLLIREDNFDLFDGKSIVQGENFRVTKNSIYRFWDHIGKFKVSNGNEITIEKVPAINKLVLRSFILGTVMASLLYQRGLFVLHASAVNINNEVIAFLGNKGYGKSTTAMTFYKEDFPIIADDYIAVDLKNNVPLVHPGFPSLRLSYKSRSYDNLNLERFYYKDYEIDKIYIQTDKKFSLNTLPLKKLYVLKRGNDLKISDFKAQKSLMQLVENTFGIERYKKPDLIQNLENCTSLLNHVTVSLLEVPDSLEKLHNVVNLIKKDIY